MRSIQPMVSILGVDHSLRQGLLNLCRSAGLEAECFETGQCFLNSDSWRELGCVLLEHSPPGMDGLELQRQLQARESRIPTVMVVAPGETMSAVQAFKQGALDVLEKPVPEQVLLEAVSRAINEAITLWELQEQIEAARRRLSRLTARERQILDFVLAGTLNKVIAYEFGISIKTVEVHRHSVMQKTKAKNLAELVDLVAMANRSEFFCLYKRESAKKIA